jgi:MinD-like ATPase involved in chromosome partitioning or flagellar assembly
MSRPCSTSSTARTSSSFGTAGEVVTVGVLLAITGSESEPAALSAMSAARDSVHVVRRCMDLADLLATAATRQASAVVVTADFRGLDAATVGRLIEEDLVLVGVVGERDSADHVLLRRLGVTAVLSTHELDGIGGFVTTTLAARRRDGTVRAHPTGAAEGRLAGPPGAGRQVAVWGPTGAPGRSTVALGLASGLARRGLSTLLLDADVYGGSVAQQLGILDEVSGLLAACRSANRGELTPAELDRHARAVDDRLTVLTGLPRADRWPELRPRLVASVLAVARSWAAWTVVDCGFSLETDEGLSHDTSAPRRNGATIAILQEVDEVVVVGSDDPVGLTRLARGLAELDAAVRLGCVRVVVNRYRPSLRWSTDEIRELLDRFTTVGDVSVLPEDRAACDRAMVQGRTLDECAAGSPLATALGELAGRLSGVPANGPARRLGWRRAAAAT